MKHWLKLIVVLCLGAAAFAQTTYRNVDDMSGWQACSTCTGGGAARYVFQQLSNAAFSRDGRSMKLGISGGSAWSHVLAYKTVAPTTSVVRHFIDDVWLLMDKPANANGFSIAGHQTIGGKHYRFSTQCSFLRGLWSIWDTHNGHWLTTSAPCTRPLPLTWQHVVIETERTTDSREHFISITVDGRQSLVNKYVYPESGSGASVGVHLEADANGQAAPFNIYWDEFNFTAW